MAKDAQGFEPNDKAQLRLTLGDRSADGKLDVNVEIYGKLPFTSGDPRLLADLGPFNVPADKLLSGLQAIASAIPPPAGQIAGSVLGVILLFLS